LLGRLGLDPATGSYFTVETHLRHLLPLHAGEVFHVTTEVVDVDEKRLRISHSLHRDADVVATAEQTLVHVDVASGRAAPVDQAVRERIEQLR